MGWVWLMLQVICFVVKVCAIVCCLFIQGSAGYDIPSPSILSPIPLIGDRTPGHVIHEKPFRSNAPSPASKRNDAVPVASPSSKSPQNPPAIRPPIPGSMPPSSHQNKTLAPLSVQISPAQIASAPRTHPVVPFILPVPVASHPLKLAGNSPPIHPTLPKEPPSNIPSASNSLAHSPFPSSKSHISPSPTPTPSPASQSGQTKNSSPRNPKMPLLPPIQALPPPPPNKDCTSILCTEPFTNTPPGSPCDCVLPIQVGLRLSVALYTFFPLVSELVVEIAAGVYMKQSQVRIMGANAASQDPEKSIVLLDLVPLGENFDFTTVYLTYQRFWHKEVAIKTSFFGDYEVLYVRYPGLPPSPPAAPLTISSIDDEPYPGHENNASAIHPLGADVRRRQNKDGLDRSIIAIIVLSGSIAVIFCCAVAWVLLFKHRNCVHQLEPTPTRLSSQKSSGIAASIIGNGPSSASLSFGSSIVTYTGSAKTFSSSDLERATDNFNASRILGEGGFGRVYSGVLEDGTKVAVKVLKRDDNHGGREFLAEIEMLSRLHHRNLVKLIGICTDERSRCLVYELIPNGSVESHLHGVDKETAQLDWGARLKIALGAARGLAYLHEDSSPRVIHRDFKSSNILLECDYMPKVSDFGLARTALDEENRHISTRVMGTFGYVAPEYAMTGHLLVKSDVYSYGVVLLELLTARKPVDMSQPPGQENLVSWARPLLTTKEGLESIVDPSLGPDFPFNSIAKVAAIASMCVQQDVSHRPFMGEVVQALKLVCNECDETKEYGSRSCSQDDFFIDLDVTRIGNNSGHSQDSLQTPSRDSNYGSGIDLERRLSMSELLSASTRYGRQESESFRRYPSSGPLRTGRNRWLWQRMRGLSGGGMSDPRLMFRF